MQLAAENWQVRVEIRSFRCVDDQVAPDIDHMGPVRGKALVLAKAVRTLATGCPAIRSRP